MHGTYAQGSGQPGNYAHPSAPFAQSLRQMTRARSYSAFDWSGGDTQAARRTASERLAIGLEKKMSDSPGMRVNLVGHSHGGNVIGGALQQLNRRVDSVTLLGTPHWEPSANPDWNADAARRVKGKIVNVFDPHDTVQTTLAQVRNTADAYATTPNPVQRTLSGAHLGRPTVNLDARVAGITVPSNALTGTAQHSNLHDPTVIRGVSNKLKID
ncbi:MAG: alpha/beta hydrolase [Gemmatimonadetes bacterium]|nr:alpha/beta hydrolase [Gemmatimonadota bacterium]